MSRKSLKKMEYIIGGEKMFIVNVEGTVFHQGHWLLIKRSMKEEHAAGTLSLVGGKVEHEGHVNNILEKSVQREIFEEVGIEVDDQMDYVWNSSFLADDHSAVINVVFLCKYKSGEAFAKSPDEVDSVHWLTTKEIVQHPLAAVWLKDSIIAAEKILNNKGDTYVSHT